MILDGAAVLRRTAAIVRTGPGPGAISRFVVSVDRTFERHAGNVAAREGDTQCESQRTSDAGAAVPPRAVRRDRTGCTRRRLVRARASAPRLARAARAALADVTGLSIAFILSTCSSPIATRSATTSARRVRDAALPRDAAALGRLRQDARPLRAGRRTRRPFDGRRDARRRQPRHRSAPGSSSSAAGRRKAAPIRSSTGSSASGCSRWRSCSLVGRRGARVVSCARCPATCRTAIIVGAGHVGQLVARKIQQHPEYGIKLVGFVDENPRARRAEIADLPVLGGLGRSRPSSSPRTRSTA